MSSLRWLVIPLVVLPITWLLFQGFGRDPRQVASPLIQRPVPSWSLTTLDGETLSSADLAGRPYVVNFWASWCIPACVDEHPVLAAAAEELGDEVVFVGVLYQDAPADARGFLEERDGKMLWLDGGPPATTKHPAQNARRFYRVLRKP